MPDLSSSYPPVDFYFQLEFEGLPTPNSNALQEVSGIKPPTIFTRDPAHLTLGLYT